MERLRDITARPPRAASVCAALVLLGSGFAASARPPDPSAPDSPLTAYDPATRWRLLGQHRIASDASAREMDLSGRECATSDVSALALSADAAMLAVGHDDGRLDMWSTVSRSPVARLQGEEEDGGGVSLLAFLPETGELLSASYHGVRIWSARERRLVRSFPASGAFELSPSGRLLAAVDTLDDVLAVWDTASGERRWRRVLGSYLEAGFTFSADSRFVLYPGGDHIGRLDAQSGRPVDRDRAIEEIGLEPSWDRPLSVSLTQDGRRLAIGTERGVVLLLDLP